MKLVKQAAAVLSRLVGFEDLVAFFNLQITRVGFYIKLYDLLSLPDFNLIKILSTNVW